MSYLSLYQDTIFDSSSYDKEDIQTKHRDTITGLLQMYNLTVTSSYDRTIKFWDVKRKKCCRKISRAHDKKIQCLLKINNSCFMSYQQDYLFFWNCRQMKIIKKISIDELSYNPQYEICIHFNHYVLINTINKNQVFSADIINGISQNEEFESFPNRISSFLALDNETFAVGHNNIGIYNYQTKNIEKEIQYTPRGYDELSLVKIDSQLLAAGSMHGFICIANWKLGTIIQHIYNNGPLVKELQLIKKKNKEKYIISITRDRSIQIWNYNSKKQIQTYYLDRQAYIFKIHNSSKILSVDRIRDDIQIRDIKFNQLKAY